MKAFNKLMKKAHKNLTVYLQHSLEMKKIRHLRKYHLNKKLTEI